jgi:hypothetical protein
MHTCYHLDRISRTRHGSVSISDPGLPIEGRPFCLLLVIWQTCNLGATFKLRRVLSASIHWWRPTVTDSLHRPFSQDPRLCVLSFLFYPPVATPSLGTRIHGISQDLPSRSQWLTLSFHDSSLCPSWAVCPTRCVSNPHVLWPDRCPPAHHIQLTLQSCSSVLFLDTSRRYSAPIQSLSYKSTDKRNCLTFLRRVPSFLK